MSHAVTGQQSRPLYQSVRSGKIKAIYKGKAGVVVGASSGFRYFNLKQGETYDVWAADMKDFHGVFEEVKP